MRYRLAHAKQRVPMPDRGPGAFFTSSKDGESINPLDPYYARMIADKDLVLVEPDPEQPAAEPPRSPATHNPKSAEGGK